MEQQANQQQDTNANQAATDFIRPSVQFPQQHLYEQKIKQLQDKIAQLVEQNQGSQDQIDYWRVYERKITNKVSELQDTVSRQETEIQNLTNRAHELEAKCQGYVATEQGHIEKLSKLQSLLDKQREETKSNAFDSSNQVNQLVREKAQLEAKINQIELQLQNKDYLIGQLNLAKQDLTRTIELKNKELSEQQDQVFAGQRKVESQELELQKLRLQLENQVSITETQANDSKLTQSRLQSENEQLRAQYQSKMNQLSQLENTQSTSKLQIMTLQREIHKLGGEINDYKNKAERAYKDSEIAGQFKKKIESEKQKLVEEIYQLKSQQNQYLVRKVLADSTCDQTALQMSNSDSVMRVVDSFAEDQHTHQEFQMMLDQLSRTNKTLENKLQSQSQTLVRQQDELQNAKRIQQKNFIRIQEMETKFDTEQRKLRATTQLLQQCRKREDQNTLYYDRLERAIKETDMTERIYQKASELKMDDEQNYDSGAAYDYVARLPQSDQQFNDTLTKIQTQDKLQSDYQKELERVADLSKKVVTLEKQLATKEQELNNMYRGIGGLKSQYQSREEQQPVSCSKSDNKELINEFTLQIKEMQISFDKQLTAMVNENKELRQQLVNLQTRNNLGASVGSFQHQSSFQSNSQAQIDASNKLAASLEKTCRENTDRIQQLTRENMELRNHAQQASSEVKGLQAGKQFLEDQQKIMQTKFEQQIIEINTARQQLVEMSSKRVEDTSSQDHIQQLQQINQALNQQIRDLQQSLQNQELNLLKQNTVQNNSALLINSLQSQISIINREKQEQSDFIKKCLQQQADQQSIAIQNQKGVSNGSTGGARDDNQAVQKENAELRNLLLQQQEETKRALDERQQLIEELQAAFSEMTEITKSKEKEFDQKINQIIKDHQVTIQSLQKKNFDLKNKAALLEQETTQLKAQIQNLTDQKDTMEFTEDMQTQEIKRLQKLESTQDQKQSTNETFLLLSNRIEKLQLEFASKDQQFEKVALAYEKLQQSSALEKTEMLAEIEKLRQSEDLLKQEINIINKNTNLRQSSNLAQLTSQLPPEGSLSDGELESVLRERMLRAERETEFLRTDNLKLLEKVRGIEMQLQAKEFQIAKLQSEVEILKQKNGMNDIKLKERNDLNEANNKLIEERNEMIERVNSIAEREKALNAQKKKLEEDKAQITQQKDQQTQKIAQQQRIIQSLHAEKAQLAKVTNQLKQNAEANKQSVNAIQGNFKQAYEMLKIQIDKQGGAKLTQSQQPMIFKQLYGTLLHAKRTLEAIHEKSMASQQSEVALAADNGNQMVPQQQQASSGGQATTAADDSAQHHIVVNVGTKRMRTDQESNF